MVIDTSAVMAILNLEPEAITFASAISDCATCLMSMGTALELSIVVEARKGDEGTRELEFFLHRAEIELVSFDKDQLKMARYAFKRYGKGRHRASLNFGDCFAYALSKTSGQALLFKGNDFSETDVIPAL